MVKRVILAMNREIRGLHEAAYLLAFFTFLSQVLALIRDRTFAHFFGAGPTLDAYFAAFRVPDIAFAFLTLFVSSFALVPLLARREGERGGVASLIGSVLVVFGVVSVGVSGALFFLVPSLIPLVLPGLSAETLESTIRLSQVMLIQPILLGLSSIVASVLQSMRRFFIYALAPIFYNLGIIFGALFLYPALGTIGLAWGVVLGAVLHLLVQTVPLVLHRPAQPLGNFVFRMKDVVAVCMLSLPRALAVSGNQLVLLAFAAAASFAAAGSIAATSFAFNLQSVTLSIVGVSYASALFPSLAHLFAKGEHETFVREVWAAVRHVIFWTLPAICLIVVLRAHIVRVILGSGEFTWSDTRLTAAVLAAFCVSLVAQATVLIFSRAYYAAERSLEPIVINVSASLVAALLALTSVRWFQEATVARYFLEDLFRITDIPGSEILMIALSYSAVFIVAALVFAVLYARRFGFEGRVITTLFFSLGASVIAGAAAYGTLQIFGPLLPTETFIGIFAQGAAAGTVGLFVWGVVLSALKSREFSEVLAIAQRFFSRLA